MLNLETRRIKTKTGIHTYCDIGNAERTFLLLHGFSFRQGLYPLAEILKSDFRVVIPDLPFSTKSNFIHEHTLDHYVDFLLAFIQELGLQEVSIFGNSVGGTLGLMCCMVDSGQLHKLVVRCPLWSYKQLPGYLQTMPLIKLHGSLSNLTSYARMILRISSNAQSR